MEVIGTLGMQLIASMVQHKIDLQKYIALGLTQELFTGAEQELYLDIDAHAHQYGVLPTLTTAEKMGVNVGLELEPPEFYLAKVEKRYLQSCVKRSLLEAQDFLKMKDPQAALLVLEEMVSAQMRVKNRNTVVNFTTQAHDMLKADYTAKMLLGDMYGVRIGWDYLDNLTSGLTAGDLLAIVGRISQGKTFQLLYMAEQNWAVHKKVPLVVSMEMKPLPLIQRIAAMHTHKPITHIKKGELSTKSYKGMLDTLWNLKNTERDFWIVDGNLTAKVKDIALLAKQLKPDIIYVDGAYLLQSDGRMNSNWERVKDTCEGLKQRVAGDLGIPVVASYQFNKEAVGAKKNAGLEHIGGTDAIGQIATIVLGLFQEDGVETIKEKEIKVLKGRNGETGSFKIRWLFDEMSDKGRFMDFSEITEEEQEYESKQDLEWV